MFQQKDLEVFVHLDPLPLIPLEVVKLNVHLQEEQREPNGVKGIQAYKWCGNSIDMEH